MGTRSGHRFRMGLVVVEVALAVALLVVAGLLIRSMWRLQATPLGFVPDQVVTLVTRPPENRYPDSAKIVAFYERLIEELRTLPEMEAVGAASQLPLGGGVYGGKFLIEGEDASSSRAATQTADYRIVTPGYLETLQIPLLKGRRFEEADRADSLPVAIIDRLVADRNWPDGSWATARIKIRTEGPWRSIVGVVENIKSQTLRSETQGIVYIPLSQHPVRSMSLVVRSALDTQGLASAAGRRVREVDPDVALDVRTLSSYVFDAQSDVRTPAYLLTILAGLALLLAIVGLYGVMSYLVGRRTREIGIRIALGARQLDILKKVASQTTFLVALGIVLGLAFAYALSLLFASKLYGVAPSDPTTYFVVSILFAGVAAVSGYLPARRASKVDPIEALRTE